MEWLPKNKEDVLEWPWPKSHNKPLPALQRVVGQDLQLQVCQPCAELPKKTGRLYTLGQDKTSLTLIYEIYRRWHNKMSNRRRWVYSFSIHCMKNWSFWDWRWHSWRCVQTAITWSNCSRHVSCSVLNPKHEGGKKLRNSIYATKLSTENVSNTTKRL